MISIVKKYLNGFEPLQRKIWLYCFDPTPSAHAFDFVMNWINEKRSNNPDQLTDDELTAWRYYSFKPNVRPCSTLYEVVVEYELNAARNSYQLQRYDFYSKAHVYIQNTRLTSRETEHGTPSCICIRNHFDKIHSITDLGTHFLNLW
jgi:hypothetical protein